MAAITDDTLIQDEEFRDIPEPQRAHAKKVEAEARVQQVLIWMANDLRGKKLIQTIMEEFKIGQAMAYQYVQKANEQQVAEVNMSPEELRAFCKKQYLELSKAKDKRIRLQATDRLAKHGSFFPSEKVEVTNKFDQLSKDELEKLAQEEGL